MTHRDCRETPATPRILIFARCLSLMILSLPTLPAWSQAALSPGPADTYAQIDIAISKRMETMDWGEGRISILIEDAEYPLTAHNHAKDTLMEPGSLMKILTAAAALENLGEDHRFATRLYVTGPIEGDTLKGALVVQGGGDPSFPVYDPANPVAAWAVFDRWAGLLRARGIREIEGPVIGDDRAFDDRPVGAGWPAGRRGDPEAPMISALNFNGNCVNLYWKTGRWARRIASCTLFPALDDYIFFSNNLRVMKTVHKPREFSRVKDGNVISASGEIEPNTQAFDRVSIDDPATFFARSLKKRLQDNKIKVPGEALAIGDHDGEINDGDLSLIDEHLSPPLKTLVEEMMHHDRTLHAECLFKALGRQAEGDTGSFENGARAVNAYFSDLRLPGANRVIVDGSGMSSFDRLSPAQLVALLRRIETRPRTRAIAGYFPKAWEKGVLENRFRPTGEDAADASSPDAALEATLKAPPVQAFTASAEGVEGMAGWVTNRVGRRLLFAIMVDESKAPAFQLRKQIDLLVLEIANSGMGQ